MMHPSTEIGFVSEEVGVGIFATELIPKGTIIWIKDDLDLILREEYIESLDDVRKELIYKYSYQDSDGEYVLCWDHGRYMNHSFNPNCADTAYDFMLAARDIYVGEQLTCDYGTLGDDEEFECLSDDGARTKVSANDYLVYYKIWDEMAREAFKKFNEVEQPLKHLINERYIVKVSAVANREAELDSFLTLFSEEEVITTLEGEQK